MNAVPLESASLEDLVERSRRGDLEAFSEVVGRLHGEVRGFLAMMAVASDWIDDVAQEVFIEAYRGLSKYEPDRSFLKWVHGIARNVVRRHAERQSRESRLRHDAVSEWLRRRQAERVDDVAPGSPLEALKSCLEKLPEHLQRMIRLQHAEHMTSGAIARVVERSADAVRMALMRARALLLQCIEGKMRKSEATP